MSVYHETRGRVSSRGNYDDRYYDLYDDRQMQLISTKDKRSRSLDRTAGATSTALVVKRREVSREPVRRSDQKYLVRSSRTHRRHPDHGRPPIIEYDRPEARPPPGIRPPIIDWSRSRSRSRSTSVSYSRSRSRSRSRSWSRSRSRSRSRDRSPLRRHRHHRHIRKVSKKTITEYEVDPKLIRRRRDSDTKIVLMGPSRVIFVRVRVTDIRPETLDHFGYPWEWDRVR